MKKGVSSVGDGTVSGIGNFGSGTRQTGDMGGCIIDWVFNPGTER